MDKWMLDKSYKSSWKISVTLLINVLRNIRNDYFEIWAKVMAPIPKSGNVHYFQMRVNMLDVIFLTSGQPNPIKLISTEIYFFIGILDGSYDQGRVGKYCVNTLSQLWFI